MLTVVTWPEEAASWLRQATRFAAADPDLWIMAGAPRGWAQMTRRLLWSTPWQPGRTLAFAALGTWRAIGLVGAHNLQGLAGATADGGTWTVCNGSIQAAPRDRRHHDMTAGALFDLETRTVRARPGTSSRQQQWIVGSSVQWARARCPLRCDPKAIAKSRG